MYLLGRKIEKLSFGYILCLLLLGALGVRVYVAVTCPGSLRADEIFQYFEPAHKIAYGTWIRTWEWRVGMRSWIVPSMMASLFHLADALHIQNLFLFIRTFFILLSLCLVGFFCWAGWLCDGRRGAILFGVVAALWPEVVSASFRPLGECFGGNLLADGVILSFIAVQWKERWSRFTYNALLMFSVFLLSCAAVARFQFAPAAGLGFLYILTKANNKKSFFLLLFVFLVPIVFMGIFDKITLGGYYQSVFRNFYINVNMGVADRFGVKSFIYYFKKYLFIWGMVSLLLTYSCVKGFPGNAYPLFIAFFIVFYHSIISHKELPFIYPAIPLLIFGACWGAVNILREQRIGYKGLLVVFIALLIFFKTNCLWQLRGLSEMAQFQEHAVHNKDICGITVFLPNETGQWGGVLGYSGLPKGVPLYKAESLKDVDTLSGKYNYIITYRGFEFLNSNVKKEDCDSSRYMCLYKLPGSCVGEKDFDEFSRSLEKGGE